jgi:hypothetical protein
VEQIGEKGSDPFRPLGEFNGFGDSLRELSRPRYDRALGCLNRLVLRGIDRAVEVRWNTVLPDVHPPVVTGELDVGAPADDFAGLVLSLKDFDRWRLLHGAF